jgi:hypothetical protein
MKNLLLVESENDKLFFEAIIKNLGNEYLIDDWINIDYECLGGEGNLKVSLNVLKNKAIKNDEIKKVGIILDQDKKTKEERLTVINSFIQNIFTQSNAEVLEDTHKFITLVVDEDTEFELACYFVNLNGQGELENILKEIKSSKSPHADCLASWVACLKTKGIDFKPKDLLKEWVRVYIRYDTCKGRERNQANRKCNFEKSLVKPVWNFKHECLDELKDFLKLFKKESYVLE